MRKPSSSRSRILAGALLLGMAAGFYHAPESLTAALRSSMHDAVHPGTKLLSWSVAESRGWIDRLRHVEVDSSRVVELEAELKAARTETRSALAQTALLNEKIAQLEKSAVNAAAPHRASASPPLLIPELLEARVLGDGTRQLWREGKLIDKGTADGLSESLFVVDDSRPIVDQGTDNGIESEQEVYAGRVVVGRIATVGRWTSSIERVTDAHYRGLAQIARQTSAGLVLGAEGILEGDGTSTCRLRDIPVTESVEVGDDVYTGGRDGRLRSILYYGKVIEARLNDGMTAWEIRVKPAADDAKLQSVHVLRNRLNPHRVLAE